MSSSQLFQAQPRQSPYPRDCNVNESSFQATSFSSSQQRSISVWRRSKAARRGESPGGPAGDLSEIWTQQAGVGSREEKGNAQARRDNVIAVGFRDALDEAVQTKAAQVISHAAYGVMGWVEAQQLSQ